MKNINFLKRAILDVILALLLFTMYKKNNISLMYHEVVGLVLGVLFIVHLTFNYKWIINQFKNFISKNNKSLFVIDLLLTLSFLIIIVTGIMISKKLFSFNAPKFVMAIHYSFAMISLVLVGVHLGLHNTFISKLFSIVNIFGDKRKIVTTVLLIMISVFGIYSLTQIGFIRMLTLPFTINNVVANGANVGRGVGGRPAIAAFSFAKFIYTIFQYSSILTLFAMITIQFKNLLKVKKVDTNL